MISDNSNTNDHKHNWISPSSVIVKKIPSFVNDMKKPVPIQEVNENSEEDSSIHSSQSSTSLQTF